jgi:ribonuclease-3
MKDGTSVNNERLEYLGDAILSAIAAEFIYREFENMDEGFMTKLRARIVKRKNLNSTAIKMGIPLLIKSHPHPANSSKHLYGNALEALIGAIYLDKGYNYTTRFFKNRMIRRHVDLNSLAKKDSDYKSQLIEWAQKNRKEVVFFSHEEYDSRSKIPSFESIVKIEQMESGTGNGDSKKEAEQQAAKVALKEISK